MVMSQGDVDMLRIFRWCRCVSQSGLEAVFSKNRIAIFLLFKLIRKHRSYDAFVLTARGHALIDTHLPDTPPNAKLTYLKGDTLRRIRLSQLMLTAYEAGLNVFLHNTHELLSTSGLYLPATQRGRGTNVWGSSRISALTLLDDTLYAIHYVAPEIGKINFADELDVLSKQASPLNPKRQALLFVGDTYASILEEINAPHVDGKRERNLVHYGTACNRSPIPVHLLSCNKVGTLQLMILSQPDYRNRLAMLSLEDDYAPPAPDLDCDAIFHGKPFLVAVDMDLQRLDRACTHDPISIVALEEQATEVLNQRYHQTGLGEVYLLSDAAIEQLLGHKPQFHVPSHKSYQSEEGEIFYDPPIPTAQKSINASGKKRVQVEPKNRQVDGQEQA
ncbi:hypothetical protein RFF05_08405 [Bengtsoniella intestinalis]|uniref:hypothetical protein n=1 Tax=Bengtsoniella intestinalis TaxID=3073143 RepID=UPI00391F7D5A